MRAYVRTSIARVDGSGYLVTVEARAAASDTALGSVQKEAAAARDVRSAAEAAGRELQRALAGGFGRLERAAGTGHFVGGSAESLRLYNEAQPYFERRDWVEAAERLRQAVRIDSTFALGWQQLAAVLTNAGAGQGERLQAQEAAYRHRASVQSPVWQLVAEAEHFRRLNDLPRALERYRRVGELSPGAYAVFENSVGLIYLAMRQPETAVRVFARIRDTTRRQPRVSNENYVRTLLDLGRVDDAAREVRLLASAAGPENAAVRVTWRELAFARKDFAALAGREAEAMRGARTPPERLAATGAARVAALALGRLRLFDSATALRMSLMRETGSPAGYVAGAASRAQARAETTGDTLGAGRQLDVDVRAIPWTSMPVLDRPYLAMIAALTALGRVNAALALRAEFEREIPAALRPGLVVELGTARGVIALAAGDGKAALAAFREADVGVCAPCAWPNYARAYDAMGNADSAAYWYERYVASTSPRLANAHAFALARTYQRLGELYERRGDTKRALQRYGDLVELWKDADPELQPMVRDVRARIARLQARRG